MGLNSKGIGMKKFLALLFCLVLIGCATSKVLTDLKNAGRNSAAVKVNGTIDEAKQIVREVTKSWDLIERKEAEKNDYMTFTTNFVKTMAKASFAGANTRRLGFFFEYDKDNNVTTITVVEWNGDFVDPIRGAIVDKIKLRQMETKIK